MSELLELVNLSVGYGSRVALESVNLTVRRGSQVAVVGPNGAGKSSMFKAMVGLLPIRAGDLRLHGASLPERGGRIAYIPQREEVDWSFPVTVRDVVTMGRYGRGKWLPRRRKPADMAAVEQVLQTLGIADLANRPIGELSGGQQQRVFFARSLAQEPEVLLLDEPFNGVDIATREVMLDVLAGLREPGVTVLLSTHDLDLAARHFDQVILINKRLISSGSPGEVFTEEHLMQAFEGRMIQVDGRWILVDHCCGGDRPGAGDARSEMDH